MGTEENADRTVKVRGLLFDAQGRLQVASTGGGGGGGGTVDQGAPGAAEWLVTDATAHSRLADIIMALAATLDVAVQNWPADFPDAAALAELQAISAALAATITVDGTVALDGPTLAALESITATIANWPGDFPDAAVLAELQGITALLSATITVDGTVALDGPTLAALETVTADQGAAGAAAWPTDASATNRFVGGKTPVCATVTASGDTDIYTPALGNRVRLWWISAINDPDEATTPLVKVLLGATECYRAYALAHWEMFEGDVDEPLTINLSGVASVAVTAHIEEFT